MDPAVNKRSQGPWGHADRVVYHPPFGDYVTRPVLSGYGQEGESGFSGTTVALWMMIGFISGQLAGQMFEARKR